MTPEELVNKSIQISNLYDAMASRLFQKAKHLRQLGEIDYPEYKQIMDNYYLPLMSYSSKILMDASLAVITNIDSYMVQLQSSTERLKSLSDRIEKAGQVFKAITFVLSSAAAIATFAAAPTPATFSAATSSISGAIHNITEVVRED